MAGVVNTFKDTDDGIYVLTNALSGYSNAQQKAILSTIQLNDTKKTSVLANLEELASGNAVTTSNIAAMASLSGLNDEEKESLLTQLGLNAADQVGLVLKTEAVIATLEQAAVDDKANEAKYRAIILQLQQNAATTDGILKTNLLTASLGGYIKMAAVWLTTTPMGWATMIISAVGIATFAWAKYNEKQEEIFQEQKSSLDEQKSELDDLKAKHEEVKKSLDDLYALRESQGLTDAEKEQLTYQETTLANLEREIEYREALAKIAAKEVNDKAVARLNSSTVVVERDEPPIGGSAAFGGGADNTYVTKRDKAVAEYVERIKEADAEVAALNKQYDDGLISAEEYASKLAGIEQTRTDAVSAGKSVVSEIEAELPYVTDEGQLSYWQGIVDSFKDTIISSKDTIISSAGETSDAIDTQPLSNLSNALKALKTDIADLETAMDALASDPAEFDKLFSALNDNGESEFLDNIISKFPQLQDELQAYNAGLISATDLQRALNQTVAQFKADTLGDQLKAVVDATEEYGDGSFQVIQAIQDMDAVLPGVSKLLLDKETALRAVESGAYKSAEAMIEFVRAEYAASTAAAQADYENLVKQFGNVNNAALRAAAAQWMQAKADQATVERILGLLAKTDREYEPKGSSGKNSKDHLLESYQTEIARLDHLREMDQINEATYYNDKLAALQTYLKDRKKYQEQWWAWEEEFHNYQKQLIEDEIDQLEDQRDKQIDTNEEYYKNLKKQKEKEYDLEKDRVDKVIDALEKEEDAKKKAIQKQRDLLDEQADDRDYNKSIEKKNKEIADIKAQLTVLDLDDSDEAKAKKIALQEELTDKLNDLEDYQYDHSIDTQKSALDKQETYWEDHFGKLIEAQELYLENLKTMYDQTIESIESSMEAMTNSIKASFESLIAAKQSLLDNAGSIPGMAEITPIGGAGSNEYKVKEGDNLSRIAKAKGTSVSKLLELNPWIKDKNKIYPGQIIKYHDGGVVGKSINDKDKEVLSQLIPVSRDEVLAKLLRGEVVVNEKQQGLMRDAWMSIAPSMALATKQADMAKALASNVTTNNSPNIVFDMKIEVGNTDAAGLTALQRQLENFKNEAVKAVYERMSNHRSKTGRINPSGRY